MMDCTLTEKSGRHAMALTSSATAKLSGPNGYWNGRRGVSRVRAGESGAQIIEQSLELVWRKVEALLEIG